MGSLTDSETQADGIWFRQVPNDVRGAPHIYAGSVGAESQVDLYQYQFKKIADNAIGELDAAILALTGIDWSGTGFGAAVGNMPGTYGISYTKPTDIPAWDYIYEKTPWNVTLGGINRVDPTVDSTHPGDFTDKPLELNQPTPVEKLDATIPNKAPIIPDYVIPDFESDTVIDQPLIRDIQFPSDLILNFEDFNATKPDLTGITAPDTDFAWTEEDYDSIILQATQSRVEEFLAGGVGIPDYVWDAIWNRGREKEEAAGTKLVSEITEEFSARGFSLPQGAQVARIDQARKSVQDASNTLNRELVIQQAQHEIENMKFAVAQGKALEEMLGGWYQASLARGLDAAKYSVQASIEIFNAQLSLVKAEVEVYRVELEAWKSELDQERLRLENYRVLMEKAKILGQLNQQEVDLFKTRWDAYNVEVNVYNSQLKAVSLKMETKKLELDAYRTEVQAFGELVQAKTAEYQGYKAQWDGEIAKTSIFDSQVKSYIGQMQGYKIETDAIIAGKDVQLKINDQTFKKFATDLSGYNAQLDGRVKELQAANIEYETKIKKYGIDVENEKNETDSQMKSKALELTRAADETKANIATAGNKTQASTAEKDMMKNTAEIMARAYSQLAASAMSVISVNAGISDSTSHSSSNSSSISYSGGDV